MGNTCCSLPSIDSSKRQIVLKLPNGAKGIAFDKQPFQPIDINQWLTDLYANSHWTGYVCYNDESPLSKHTTKGHCKGILTWNANRIGWLIHSVPRFPLTFNGKSISPIDVRELLFGQSFLYVEQSRSNVDLDQVLRQLLWMDPNLFHPFNVPTVALYLSQPLEIKQLRWSPTMTHLAKSPRHPTDYIGAELCKLNPDQWYEESWKRGSEYPTATNPQLRSIQSLCIETTTFTSSQDHSKWAATTDRVWIGDLNHMKSQEKRGGGGMVIQDVALANAFRELIKICG